MTLLIHSQILNDSLKLMTTNTPNHRHEQLLMGWKQGAMMMEMTRKASRHNNDIDGHHHPLSLTQEGDISCLFWVTTTTTPPSLTPNMRGGVSHLFWATTTTTPPSLTPNARGGVSCLFLVTTTNTTPLPHSKHMRGGFSFIPGNNHHPVMTTPQHTNQSVRVPQTRILTTYS